MSKSAIAVILLTILGLWFSAAAAGQNPKAVLPELATQAFVGTQAFGPQNDEEWVTQCLNLNLDQEKLGCRIVAYKILWYGNGKWSPWFVPGVNDLYKKEGESLRRYWACFNDHDFEILYTADAKKQFLKIKPDSLTRPADSTFPKAGVIIRDSEPLKLRLDAILSQLNSKTSLVGLTPIPNRPKTIQQAALHHLPVSLIWPLKWCLEYKGFFIYSFPGTAEKLFTGHCYAIKKDNGQGFDYDVTEAMYGAKTEPSMEVMTSGMRVKESSVVLALDGTVICDQNGFKSHPAALQSKIKWIGTIREIVKLLGPGYASVESGIGPITWYFDDSSTVSTKGWPVSLDEKVEIDAWFIDHGSLNDPDTVRKTEKDLATTAKAAGMTLNWKAIEQSLQGTVVCDKKGCEKHPSALKKKIKPASTVRDIVQLLGPGYVSAESGTGSIIWFFDDGSTASTICWPKTLDDKVKLW